MEHSDYLNPTKEQIKKLYESEYDGPVYMLNLLKYKDDVDGKSGKEVYKTYMHAATPFIEKSSGEVIFYGNPIASIIGPIENEWHKVLIVKYPTKEHFLNMIREEDYPHQIRSRALENSRLICMTQ